MRRKPRQKRAQLTNLGVTILSTLYYVHLLPERVRLSHAVDWQRLESIVPEVES